MAGLKAEGAVLGTVDDRNFWVNFMAATGFVNRLWDLRRIIDVYLDAKLDLETRKATIMGGWPTSCSCFRPEPTQWLRGNSIYLFNLVTILTY
jgi:hypothetical protein